MTYDAYKEVVLAIYGEVRESELVSMYDEYQAGELPLNVIFSKNPDVVEYLCETGAAIEELARRADEEMRS